ncbi:hypothetical protein GCM10009662_67910 [Catellatospora coxensis]|uniref:Uncharacterized protein n=1 Tax=Catellatospora coxensis TaxID=310354 RepID=A0A8J3L383_9ACTN|nr:hypothetical protein Cco03nite_72740 [Catellatospora coxensis]
MIDLTGPPSALTEAATDAVDEAARAALAELPGAVALWRAWRTGAEPDATRVLLAEVDLPRAELPRVAARITAAVGGDAAGPLVELLVAGVEPSAYQWQIRRGAALLWAAEVHGPVLIARAFDVVDPVTGPGFDPGHERLAGTERDAVLRYLEDAPVLLSSTERMADVVDPVRGEVVPLDQRTDGAWVWTDCARYYLARHGLAPDPEFLAAIRARDYTLPVVTAIGRHRALAELFRPVEAAPAWSI